MAQFRLEDLYGEGMKREGVPGDEYELKPGQFAKMRPPTVELHRKARAVVEKYREDPERLLLEVGKVVLEASFEMDGDCRLDMLSKAVGDFFSLSVRTTKGLFGGLSV